MADKDKDKLPPAPGSLGGKLNRNLSQNPVTDKALSLGNRALDAVTSARSGGESRALPTPTPIRQRIQTALQPTADAAVRTLQGAQPQGTSRALPRQPEAPGMLDGVGAEISDAVANSHAADAASASKARQEQAMQRFSEADTIGGKVAAGAKTVLHGLSRPVLTLGGAAMDAGDAYMGYAHNLYGELLDAPPAQAAPAPAATATQPPPKSDTDAIMEDVGASEKPSQQAPAGATPVQSTQQPTALPGAQNIYQGVGEHGEVSYGDARHFGIKGQEGVTSKFNGPVLTQPREGRPFDGSGQVSYVSGPESRLGKPGEGYAGGTVAAVNQPTAADQALYGGKGGLTQYEAFQQKALSKAMKILNNLPRGNIGDLQRREQMIGLANNLIAAGGPDSDAAKNALDAARLELDRDRLEYDKQSGAAKQAAQERKDRADGFSIDTLTLADGSEDVVITDVYSEMDRRDKLMEEFKGLNYDQAVALLQQKFDDGKISQETLHQEAMRLAEAFGKISGQAQ